MASGHNESFARNAPSLPNRPAHVLFSSDVAEAAPPAPSSVGQASPLAIFPFGVHLLFHPELAGGPPVLFSFNSKLKTHNSHPIRPPPSSRASAASRGTRSFSIAQRFHLRTTTRVVRYAAEAMARIGVAQACPVARLSISSLPGFGSSLSTFYCRISTLCGPYPPTMVE